MKNLPTDFPTMDAARKFGKQVVKDGSNVRVKFGKTNGRICLHVFVPGATLGRTIYTPGEWENHPANQRQRRNKNFAAEQPIEALMANKDTR